MCVELDEEVDESMRISTESIGTLTSEPLRLEEEQFTRFLLLQDYQLMILVLLPRSISPSFHLSNTFSPSFHLFQYLLSLVPSLQYLLSIFLSIPLSYFLQTGCS